MLVRALRIYRELSGSTNRPNRVTAPQVIEKLREKGLWNHETKVGKNGEETSSNAVYFHREFTERWLKHKWIERDEAKKRYILTEEGHRVVDTFYIDEGVKGDE